MSYTSFCTSANLFTCLVMALLASHSSPDVGCNCLSKSSGLEPCSDKRKRSWFLVCIRSSVNIVDIVGQRIAHRFKNTILWLFLPLLCDLLRAWDVTAICKRGIIVNKKFVIQNFKYKIVAACIVNCTPVFVSWPVYNLFKYFSISRKFHWMFLLHGVCLQELLLVHSEKLEVSVFKEAFLGWRFWRFSVNCPVTRRASWDHGPWEVKWTPWG